MANTGSSKVYTIDPTFTIEPTDSIPSLFRRRAAAYPDDVAAEEKRGIGYFAPVTTSEICRRGRLIARGLMAEGIMPGDSVAILAATSLEWFLLDLATLSVGGVVVPIYESDSASQIQHILTDANVRFVITDTVQQAELVQSVRAPSVRAIKSIDRGALHDLAKAAQKVDIELHENRCRSLRADDLATIIYTSGTTGVPKGVELTHRNFIGSIAGISEDSVLGTVVNDKNASLLLFLPVAHVLARVVLHAVMSGRARVGFSPDIRNLMNDITAFKPSALLVVPRVLEKVYNAAASKAIAPFKRKVFSWALKENRKFVESEEDGTTTLADKARHSWAHKLVLQKIQNAMGPNLNLIVSGGAPLSKDLDEFFRGMNIRFIQGYGLSETTGPITVQRMGDKAICTVGQILPGNSMRISDNGELLVKGVAVSHGYHNSPKETEGSFSDGWFHTGDLGTIEKNGDLKITGRLKEIIVTAGGKNVSPEILEESLQTHPLISQVVVVGDNRPYVGALISLDPEMLSHWLASHGLVITDPSHAIELPEIRQSLQRAIDRANRTVSRAESIRRFRLIDVVFTVENGYLTPSLKLRRSLVLHDYAHEIDALYNEENIKKVKKNTRNTLRRKGRLAKGNLFNLRRNK